MAGGRYLNQSNRSNRKVKKIWAYAYMPILYIIFAAVLIVGLTVPYLEPIGDAFSILSSERTPDVTTLHSMFTGKPEVVPTIPPSEAESSIGEPVDPDQIVIHNRDIVIPTYNTEYAHLTYERLGIDSPVYWGDSKAALAAGAGQYTGSWMPGYGGTTLIAGHNYSVFFHLNEAEIGDRVTLTTNYGVFEYEVSDIQIFDHNDKDAYDLISLDHELLALYTCWPKNRMAGVKLQRIFVYCEKISGPIIIGLRD